MPQLLEVKPLEKYNLFCRYSDSTEGKISISNLLSKNDFYKLKDIAFFQKVGIDPFTNDISWGEGISLCRNAVYKLITLINLMKKMSIDIDKL